MLISSIKSSSFTEIFSQFQLLTRKKGQCINRVQSGNVSNGVNTESISTGSFSVSLSLFSSTEKFEIQFLYSSNTKQMQYISHNWFLTSGVYMTNNTCGSSKQSEQERKNKPTDKKQTSEDLSELVPALKLLRITKFSGMIILKRQGSVLQTRPQIRRNAVNSMSRKHFL